MFLLVEWHYHNWDVLHSEKVAMKTLEEAEERLASLKSDDRTIYIMEVIS